jgi:hypothetical protein
LTPVNDLEPGIAFNVQGTCSLYPGKCQCPHYFNLCPLARWSFAADLCVQQPTSAWLIRQPELIRTWSEGGKESADCVRCFACLKTEWDGTSWIFCREMLKKGKPADVARI